MPIFTTLLFLFLALGLLPLAFRGNRVGNRVRQSRRELSVLEDRMALGASICITAARQAFGVELDESLDSIATLDSVITTGWSPAPPPEATAGIHSGTGANDLVFVLAGYLGTTFVRNRSAIWRMENDKPALYFQSVKESEYPFELLELKLKEPQRVNLSQETARWGLPPEPPSLTSDEPTFE